MRSSNCFIGDSWGTVSVMIWNVSFSCCEFVYSSKPNKVAWASCVAVSTLRRSAWAASKFGLFGLLRGLIFRQQVLDLRGGCVVINGLLQRVPFRVGRAEHHRHRHRHRRRHRRPTRPRPPNPTAIRASITFWTSGCTALHSVSLVKLRS